MEGDFEFVVLSCGHSINSYRGFGICQECCKKTCGQCLILVDGLILCSGLLGKEPERELTGAFE